MTPKEKAQDLILKYLRIENTNEWWSKVPAKRCSLIAVNEILNGSRLFYIEDYKYWEEVKQEIEKL